MRHVPFILILVLLLSKVKIIYGGSLSWWKTAQLDLHQVANLCRQFAGILLIQVKV